MSQEESARESERPLRRSLFFVPGGEPRKLEKAPGLGADTLLLDLEDSVSLPEKERARELVAHFLRSGVPGPGEPAVRVNPPGTPYFEDDLEAVVGAGARAILLPKSESREGLVRVAEEIEALERRHAPERAGATRLLALVETAAGVLGLGAAGAAVPRLDALCFGHADFSRDMELPVADASVGAAYHARCSLALAARASGLAPIDTVYLDVRDAEGCRRDAEQALALGFDGKLCIHPAQVAIVNEVYTPTEEQIAGARRVIAAAEEAEAQGKGVFTVDGKMVDAPLVASQRRVLDRARRAGILDDT